MKIAIASIGKDLASLRQKTDSSGEQRNTISSHIDEMGES